MHNCISLFHLKESWQLTGRRRVGNFPTFFQKLTLKRVLNKAIEKSHLPVSAFLSTFLDQFSEITMLLMTAKRLNQTVSLLKKV